MNFCYPLEQIKLSVSIIKLGRTQLWVPVTQLKLPSIVWKPQETLDLKERNVRKNIYFRLFYKTTCLFKNVKTRGLPPLDPEHLCRAFQCYTEALDSTIQSLPQNWLAPIAGLLALIGGRGWKSHSPNMPPMVACNTWGSAATILVLR